MELLLLGTGAADGWPNPFCRCGSCSAQRAAGVLRTPVSVLVDGRLLLDCGPTAPTQAARFGADLASVETILVTHAHSDHLDPAFLLHRSWITDAPLRVIGPDAVIARCREWLDPAQTAVELVRVTAGDELELGVRRPLTPGGGGSAPAGDELAVGAYRVRVLPAAHEAFGEAVLYRVGDGTSEILYATDTGPWHPDADLSGRFAAVLLEQTFGDRADLAGDHHHHLGSFAEAVDALRAAGSVDDRTRIVAVHLSHHNPPEPELQARLAALGVEAHADGVRVRV